MYIVLSKEEINHHGHFERDANGELCGFRSLLTGALYPMADVDKHSAESARAHAKMNPLGRVYFEWVVIEHTVSGEVYFDGDEYTLEDVIVDNQEVDAGEFPEFYELACDALVADYIDARGIR